MLIEEEERKGREDKRREEEEYNNFVNTLFLTINVSREPARSPEVMSAVSNSSRPVSFHCVDCLDLCKIKKKSWFNSHLIQGVSESAV